MEQIGYSQSDRIFIPNVEGLIEHYFRSQSKRDKFIFYYLSEDDQLLGEEVIIDHNKDASFSAKCLFSLSFYKASKLLILRMAESYEELPSQFDINNFAKLKAVLGTVNVKLKDYFIISETDYYSFLMNGRKRRGELL